MGYQIVCVPLLFILIIGVPGIEGLFTNTSVSFVGKRNISCNLMVDYFALLPYQRNITGWNTIVNYTSTYDYDFCLYQRMSITLRNGTVVNSSLASAISGINTLKQYITARCSSTSFQPSNTPIGYGTCTRLPYETYTTTMCICSTNNCNVDYSSCVASVQASQTSPPANLPSYIPELTNIISCQNGYQGSTYADYYHGQGWLYTEYIPFDMTAVRAYQSTRAVACALNVNIQTGDYYQFPLMYDVYADILYLILSLKQVFPSNAYAESATSAAVQMTSVYYTNATSGYWYSNTFQQVVCVCTTNNCNQALSTCASGLAVNVSSTTSGSTVANSNGTASSATTTQASTGNPGPTAAPTTTSTSAPGRCFSAMNRVRRADGALIMMKDVRIGDRLLDAQGQYSPVLTFFVHQQQGLMVNYLQITTAESTLEITPTHLILMRHQDDPNPPKYLQASRLRLGDSIFSVQSNASETTMKEMPVIQITANVKQNSAYAPLTESGTLVVENTPVSCYAQYEYHSLIHSAMLPLRLWYRIQQQGIGAFQRKGLHPYLQFCLSVTHFLDLAIHTV